MTRRFDYRVSLLDQFIKRLYLKYKYFQAISVLECVGKALVKR